MPFTEDQIAFRDTLKRFIDKEVVPIADEVDRNDRFPAELVPKFGDMGLLQLRLPESYGGPGANLTTVCIAAEEFAKVSESIALISGQNGIAMIVRLMQCRDLNSFVYERTSAADIVAKVENRATRKISRK